MKELITELNKIYAEMMKLHWLSKVSIISFFGVWIICVLLAIFHYPFDIVFPIFIILTSILPIFILVLGLDGIEYFKKPLNHR